MLRQYLNHNEYILLISNFLFSILSKSLEIMLSLKSNISVAAKSDKMKIEAFDSLYEVESVKDASPDEQHRSRKYWWKVFYKDAIAKHSDTIKELGVNFNNGLGDLYTKIESLPADKKAEILLIRQ